MSSPPPLPPRARTPSHLSPYYPHANPSLHTSDPRTSSTQSLVPSEAPVSKRKLLIVYIHGFYGNNQSFQSFPAHVHALLKELLVDTHVVHSKIYPRYKTYKAIEVARDNFSAWLEPHEHDGTDVVLVGHSMGGLLAGEVILMPNTNPYKAQPFKHRILGTIAMDSPFLGLHPGIVVSGIASLFQPSPNQGDLQLQQPPGQETLSAPFSSEPSSSTEKLSSSATAKIDPADTGASPRPQRQPTDPHFDPPYYNDAPFREKPLVKRLINFTAKHKREGLLVAVGRHITSHLEFGGCLADYRGLHVRYNRLRALEDVDEIKKATEGHPTGAYARVRFVNYYTLSPGRPKPVKADEMDSQETQAAARESADLQLSELDIQDVPVSRSPGPEIGHTPEREVEETTRFNANPDSPIADTAEANPQNSRDQEEEHDETPSKTALEPRPDDTRPISMQDVDPISLTEAEAESQESQSQTATTSDDLDLPPIPHLPPKPTPPDINAIVDKDAKKQAERESKRLQKAYAQAVKDRRKAIQERDNVLEKRRKKAAKEAEKQAKDAAKTMAKQEKQEQKRRARAQRQADEAVSVEEDAEQDGNEDARRPGKLNKFCALPSKRDGARDPTWVDVYMDGLDQVGAHCGLFLPGPHYDGLVGDVGSRIAAWVGDELTKRAILEA